MTLREAFKNLSAACTRRPSSALRDFPGFEGLSVRKVSPRELDDLAADDQAGNDRARSACLFAANPDGSRLFELSDALWLGTKDALPLVERINHYGRRYNGLTEESRKGPALRRASPKNSGGGVDAGSPCCSMRSVPGLGRRYGYDPERLRTKCPWASTAPGGPPGTSTRGASTAATCRRR